MKKNERFTDTYNRYGDLIFWYAKRRLSNEELSKECTQQVFLKYYEHMDVISEEMVKAWLLTCCKNEIIDYFRRIERRKGFENIDAPEVEVHICSQDNAEYVVERLNREAFYTEVLTLCVKRTKAGIRLSGLSVSKNCHRKKQQNGLEFHRRFFVRSFIAQENTSAGSSRTNMICSDADRR